MFDQLKERWQFAIGDEQQWYETTLVSQRRFFNQIALYPVNFMHDRLLRPDRPAYGMFGAAAAWRFVDQWLMKATGGQLVRSMTSGYGKRQSYLQAKEVAGGLIAAAISAEGWKDGSLTAMSEIKQAIDSPLYALLDASDHAGDLIDQFMRGTLPVTPGNVAKLEAQCKAMAQLARERGDLLGAPSGGVAPVESLRQMLAKPKLENARDLQQFFALVAALISDAALPFGSEIYVPQDTMYLSSAETETLTQYVKQHTPAANASQAELLQFANGLRAHVTGLFGARLPLLLNFADTHLQMMERLLVPDESAKTREAVALNTDLALMQKPVLPVASPWPVATNDFSKIGTALSAMAHYLVRPEATHEIRKLFGRSFANQILAMPTGIAEEMLRNFFETSQPGKPKSGFDALLGRLGGAEVATKSLFNHSHFRRTLNSKGFHFIAKPLAASAGTVVLRDAAMGWNAALAIEHGGQASLALADGLHACLAHTPILRERLESLSKPHPSLIELLGKPDNQTLLAKLETQGKLDSESEYDALARLFDAIGQIGVSAGEAVWAPLVGGAKDASMQSVIGHLLHHPVRTASQAALAMAFVDTFMKASIEGHAMAEYLDVREIPLTAAQTDELADFIAAQAKAGGIHKQPDAQRVIHFAASMMDKLRELGIAGRLQSMLDETYRDVSYGEHIARAMVQPKPAAPAAAAQTSAPELLSTPWQKRRNQASATSLTTRVAERYNQPEVGHEMQKLYDRQQGEKTIGALSSVVENSLRHGNSLLDRGNLINAAWQYLVHPFVYGKGIVQVGEAINEAMYGTQSTVREVQQLQRMMKGLQLSAMKIQPELAAQIADEGIANAAFVKLKKDASLHDVALLAAKPKATRTEADHARMNEFLTRCGDAMMQGYGALFGAMVNGGKPLSLADTLEHTMNAPTTSLAHATLAAGFAGIVLNESAKQQQMLRYLPPNQALLSHKALAQVAAYAVAQADNAGLMLAGSSLQGKVAKGVSPGELVQWNEQTGQYQHPDADTLIRFVNLVNAKLKHAEQTKDVGGFAHRATHGVMSEKLLDEMQKNVIAPLVR